MRVLLAANILMLILTWCIAPWPMVWFGSFGCTVGVIGVVWFLSTEPNHVPDDND